MNNIYEGDLFIIRCKELSDADEVAILDLLADIFDNPIRHHRVQPEWSKDFHYTECEYAEMN